MLEKGCELGEKADLCLAMGSSLTVTPAADIPKVSVLINLFWKEAFLLGSYLLVVHIYSDCRKERYCEWWSCHSQLAENTSRPSGMSTTYTYLPFN